MTASFTFHNTKLAILPDELRLLRKDPVRKMHRYYFMTVQRDLFGGASLVREWGRVGQAGQVRSKEDTAASASLPCHNQSGILQRLINQFAQTFETKNNKELIRCHIG
jgi:predicted DNA-binding WGR domain protein